MIIVRISGGIGNQLFQYSLARAIKQHMPGVEVGLDDESYRHPKSHQTPRSFLLNKFNITLPITTMDEKMRAGISHAHDKTLLSLLKKKISILINSRKPLNHRKFILEPSFAYCPEMSETVHDDSFVSGIWQSERYFKDIAPILHKELTLKDLLSPTAEAMRQRINRDGSSVSVHVRRGDYTRLAKIRPLPTDYYQRSFDYIRERIPNARFYIFSDDMEWTKTHFSAFENIVYASNQGMLDYEELTLMSSCRYHIIANSTFSWWGAWLDSRAEKIVITPNKWFSDSDADTKDLIPEEWVQL